MIEQSAKRYALRFKARVQIDLYYDLFKRRLEGERIIVNRSMEAQFLDPGATSEEREVGELISRWHTEQIPRLRAELESQRVRLQRALDALTAKSTKRYENEKRIATNKIEKLSAEIARHCSEAVLSDLDERIFPFHYLSMVCSDGEGRRVVRPVRYLMRPRTKGEDFDVKFGGCYNARADSLETVPWWSDSFGSRHGVVLVRKFYENVERCRYRSTDAPMGGVGGAEDEGSSGSLVLCFQPSVERELIVPTLWDEWHKDGVVLYSCAIITGAPLPEVLQAGHDRTPAFLRQERVDEWLTPTNELRSTLSSLLVDRPNERFEHVVVRGAR